MQNDRPVDNPHIAQCRAEMLAIMRHYDLAGGLCLTDGEEMAYAYQMSATFNAIVDDPDLPDHPGLRTVGFRIRAKESELGRDRAQELVKGVGTTITALLDFGIQTEAWMRDLLSILHTSGIRITYRPFGGTRLPRLTSLP